MAKKTLVATPDPEKPARRTKKNPRVVRPRPPEKDPRVTKRRVTITSTNGAVSTVQVDYVRPDFLAAYVEAARAGGATVEVSDEPDAGPGGYDGATHVPATLNHPLAGQTFPANEKEH